MTAHSQPIAASKSPTNGSLPTTRSQALKPFEVPAEVVRQLWLDTEQYWSDDAPRILARAKYEGTAGAIPRLAAEATAALAPVERETLRKRLTMLGMSMANGRDKDEATAWLHETTRLLEDLPESVMFQAIDNCVKSKAFLPAVAEIRERADPAFAKLARRAARLNRLAQMLADGVPLPPYEPPQQWGLDPNGGGVCVKPAEPNCTPEQAAAILAEFGLKSSFAQGLAANLDPDQPRQHSGVPL